jgi:hypothetical protein
VHLGLRTLVFTEVSMVSTARNCIPFILASAAALACVSPRSGRGLRLPEGDVTRGKAAFMDMKCNACHEVAGAALPRPHADPPVPVVLGGPVPYLRTDGELITAITNPSHSLARGYPAEAVRSGRGSRMGDFSNAMQVRQLVDIVAFLQSTYVLQTAEIPGQ